MRAARFGTFDSAQMGWGGVGLLGRIYPCYEALFLSCWSRVLRHCLSDCGERRSRSRRAMVFEELGADLLGRYRPSRVVVLLYL